VNRRDPARFSTIRRIQRTCGLARTSTFTRDCCDPETAAMFIRSVYQSAGSGAIAAPILPDFPVSSQ
jgi:hypothetical protein